MAVGDTFQEIGTELHIALGRPTAMTSAAFALLAYVEVLGVISIPERGDTVADVSESTLKDGRVEHFNGPKDGGALVVPIKYIEGDAGQERLLGVSGTNDTVSVMEIDTDGVTTYYLARVAEMKRRESTTSSFKGYMLGLRINSERIEAA